MFLQKLNTVTIADVSVTHLDSVAIQMSVSNDN